MDMETGMTGGVGAARRLLRAIETFRQIDPEIQAQAVAIFCLVAGSGDPVSMSKIKQELAIAQSSVSRNVALLGKVTRHHHEGPDLLTSWENPENRREKLVALTHKGRRLMAILVGLLENHHA